MKIWPHAPLHAFNETGTYMITAGTLYKEHFFKGKASLDLLQDQIMELAEHYKWRLEAWSIFSNHYHIIIQATENSKNLNKFLVHLHSSSARMLNLLHKTPGRRVWYEFWDTKLTFQSSYLARLNYVMNNPVKHKIVDCASLYPWCSASWFENNTTKAYFKTVTSFGMDNLNIYDDF